MTKGTKAPKKVAVVIVAEVPKKPGNKHPQKDGLGKLAKSAGKRMI